MLRIRRDGLKHFYLESARDRPVYSGEKFRESRVEGVVTQVFLGGERGLVGYNHCGGIDLLSASSYTIFFLSFFPSSAFFSTSFSFTSSINERQCAQPSQSNPLGSLHRLHSSTPYPRSLYFAVSRRIVPFTSQGRSTAREREGDEDGGGGDTPRYRINFLSRGWQDFTLLEGGRASRWPTRVEKYKSTGYGRNMFEKRG